MGMTGVTFDLFDLVLAFGFGFVVGVAHNFIAPPK